MLSKYWFLWLNKRIPKELLFSVTYHPVKAGNVEIVFISLWVKKETVLSLLLKTSQILSDGSLNCFEKQKMSSREKFQVRSWSGGQLLKVRASPPLFRPFKLSDCHSPLVNAFRNSNLLSANRYMAGGERTCKTKRKWVVSGNHHTVRKDTELSSRCFSLCFSKSPCNSQHTFLSHLLPKAYTVASLGDLFWSLHMGWGIVFVFTIVPLPSVTASPQIPNSRSKVLFTVILSQLSCLSLMNRDDDALSSS